MRDDACNNPDDIQPQYNRFDYTLSALHKTGTDPAVTGARA